MLQNEIKEIKKRFTAKGCTVDRVSGCYVNGDKNIVATFSDEFSSLPDEVVLKYHEILKKTLSGKLYDNLIELEFPLAEESAENDGAQYMLMNLRGTNLKSKPALNAFYQKVIDTYDCAENYVILLFHDAYDIPMKTTDDKYVDDSEEVYEYIVCAICPVVLSKPGLAYHDDAKNVEPMNRDWEVSAVDSAFIFPCFTERSSDIHSVMTYSKTPKAPHKELWMDLLRCEGKYTSSEKKELVTRCITSGAVAANDSVEIQDVVGIVQREICDYVKCQPYKDDAETRQILLTSDTFQEIIESTDKLDINTKNEIIHAFEESFDGSNSIDLPFAEEIMDEKLAEKVADNEEKKELRKNIADLKVKLNAKCAINIVDDTVSIDKGTEFDSTPAVKEIDGKTFLMVEVPKNTKVNINV